MGGGDGVPGIGFFVSFELSCPRGPKGKVDGAASACALVPVKTFSILSQAERRVGFLVLWTTASRSAAGWDEPVVCMNDGAALKRFDLARVEAARPRMAISASACSSCRATMRPSSPRCVGVGVGVEDGGWGVAAGSPANSATHESLTEAQRTRRDASGLDASMPHPPMPSSLLATCQTHPANSRHEERRSQGRTRGISPRPFSGSNFSPSSFVSAIRLPPRPRVSASGFSK